MSFQILRDAGVITSILSKRQKENIFLILYSHQPRVLFKIINSALNAPQTVGLEPSPEMCENFLQIFIDKIASLRALVSPPAIDPSVLVPCAAKMDTFEPVTLLFVQDIVKHLKPSGSPADIVPSRLFKEVFQTVGPSLLEIINSSLSSGVVPKNFKHAVVQPLLKKPGLDPTVLTN